MNPSGRAAAPVTHFRRLLYRSLLASALIFAALELWRPCFFLTDDNLDAGLPVFTEIGHRLLAGQSPFISDHLFGGGYNLLRDPNFFVWHPLYLVASLLVATPFHFLIIDVDAFVLLMLATAGFVALADYLRSDLELPISDGWIMFYALSYTYSLIALATGASWVNFLGNHGALPWLALGILHRNWKWAVACVALFSMHQLLGGHFSPTISTSLFLTALALGASFIRRSWVPLGGWLAGTALAIVLLLPLLLPAANGFFSSGRSQGVNLADMRINNVEFTQFPVALFFGMAAWMKDLSHPPPATYTLALGASIAAWCLLPVLLHRKWQRLDLLCVALMAGAMLLICRPVWLAEIMLRLPLFRSMRWPFREFLQFQFFLHLLLLLRTPRNVTRGHRLLAVGGIMLVLVPMLLLPQAPSLSTMNRDRNLLRSGEFQRYWQQVRLHLAPGDRYVVLLPVPLYLAPHADLPFSLLGTYDYAMLADSINGSGYSPTVPLDHLYLQTKPLYPFGAYSPDQKPSLLAEKPLLKFITLESLDPLRITLSSAHGPALDLTPFLTESFRTSP